MRQRIRRWYIGFLLRATARNLLRLTDEVMLYPSKLSVFWSIDIANREVHSALREWNEYHAK